MIPWRPIAELPDALKDGREVLVWAGDIVAPEVAAYDAGLWVNRDGATVRGITHFAEINPPGAPIPLQAYSPYDGGRFVP